MSKMGIETKYEYIYYTILDVDGILELLREAGAIDEMIDTLSIQERHSIWKDSLNKVFKDSKDYTVNNFRVDETRYCDDIKQWTHRNRQHKECPVFVKYNDKQPVKVEGEGYMFCLYEKKEDNDYESELLSQRYSGNETMYNYEVHGIEPPDWFVGNSDGLAGAGGRL